MPRLPIITYCYQLWTFCSLFDTAFCIYFELHESELDAVPHFMIDSLKPLMHVFLIQKKENWYYFIQHILHTGGYKHIDQHSVHCTHLSWFKLPGFCGNCEECISPVTVHVGAEQAIHMWFDLATKTKKVGRFPISHYKFMHCACAVSSQTLPGNLPEQGDAIRRLPGEWAPIRRIFKFVDSWGYSIWDDRLDTNTASISLDQIPPCEY